MDAVKDVRKSECALWVDQEVEGNLWRFYYKQIEGQWVKYSKIQLMDSGVSLFH